MGMLSPRKPILLWPMYQGANAKGQQVLSKTKKQNLKKKHNFVVPSDKNKYVVVQKMELPMAVLCSLSIS